jgi:hypothetical protein
MKNYSEKLKDPRWQKRRLEILNRDNWKCKCCKDEDTTLHVHHIKYTGNPWDAKDDDLITLCAHCHNYVSERKVDISSLVLPCAFKAKYEDGACVLFFKRENKLSYAVFRNEVFTLSYSFDDSDIVEIMQLVAISWFIEGKDDLAYQVVELFNHFANAKN